MTTLETSPFLRRALVADAVISGMTGLLMALGAAVLQETLGLPAALTRTAGFVLLPFAAFLVYLWRSDPISRTGVWWVIAMNVAWVAASLALLLSDWIGPTVLGSAFILAQAVAVAAFAAFQYAGLRRSTWRVASAAR